MGQKLAAEQKKRELEHASKASSNGKTTGKLIYPDGCL
jgi:hypothetical protein